MAFWAQFALPGTEQCAAAVGALACVSGRRGCSASRAAIAMQAGLGTLGKRDIPDSGDGPATVAKPTKKPTLPQGQRSVLDLFGLSNKK